MSNIQIQVAVYAKFDMEKIYQIYKQKVTRDQKQLSDLLFNHNATSTSVAIEDFIVHHDRVVNKAFTRCIQLQ